MASGRWTRCRAGSAAPLSVCCLAVVSAFAVVPAAGASPSPSPRIAAARAEIAESFRHLADGPPDSASALRPYVQGADGALVSALVRGADNQRTDDRGLLVDGRVTVSGVRLLSSSEASVDFAVAEPGGASVAGRFVGTAVRSGGRWKVSWTTACFLVEQEGVPCPDLPEGVAGTAPLPYSRLAEAQNAAVVPGLLRPGPLATLPDGSVLVEDTDRDQILRLSSDARCHVLEITPGGLLVEHPGRICATGVAVSPSGTLYVADDTQVYVLAPSGALTVLARSGTAPGAVTTTTASPPTAPLSTAPPSTAPASSAVPSAVGFSPSLLALDGSGDLVVYSNGVRSLWRLTPSGRLSDLGADYVDGMATAPDGTVLLAEHGGGLGEVTASGLRPLRDLSTTKIAGYGVPGMRGGFEADGVAVAPDGAVYLDTAVGNGYTDATALAELPPDGTPREVPVGTGVIDTLPTVGAAGFLAATYPAPRATRYGPQAAGAAPADPVACPSPSGLERFTSTAAGAARRVAKRFNAFVSSFWGDLCSSDRAWWPGLFTTWASGSYDRDTHTVLSAHPASEDPFAAAVAKACGGGLVRDSEVVVVGPSAYSFQVSHLFFLDRDGHLLVYFQAS